MLTEEGLIVIAGLVGCGLVILGALELIAPTRPRSRLRRPHPSAGPRLGTEPRLPQPAPPPPERVPEPLGVPVAAGPSCDHAREPDVEGEPPIERLLRKQAEDLGTAGMNLELAAPHAARKVMAGGAPAGSRRTGGARRRRPGGSPGDGQGAASPAAPEDPPDWAACEGTARRLADQGEFAAAARILREALGDARCPEPLREALGALLATLAGREAGLLTANAVRLVDGREAEALAALDRAEAFLAGLPGEAVPPRRRRELEQRLWWGYTKLGTRLAGRERWDEALEPLLRALQFPGVGPERQEETRQQLGRAVDGLVGARAEVAARLIEDGDRDGARAVCEMLRDVLEAAVERGLDAAALDVSLGRTEALMDQLGARS